MCDFWQTGKSKHFGFMEFEDPEVVDFKIVVLVEC
jgi:RNA recognition motif-containing protein